jgi:hypothetical protein
MLVGVFGVEDMDQLNFYKLLSYGAIGLGCILAVLSFFLLRKEQDKPQPRQVMLHAIKMYMAFSLFLTVVGFVAEYLHYNATQAIGSKDQTISELKAQLEERKTELDAAKKSLSTAQEKISNLAAAHKVLDALMSQKDGKVQRLSELDPKDMAFGKLVNEIRKDLESIDKEIQKSLHE